MPQSPGGAVAAASEDPAYPTTTPPDSVYPCQSLDPLGAPLEGVATPAIWSRLAGPLERAPVLLWERLGLLARGLPERWSSIHYGRIALNAHGWERLRSRMLDVEPDAALVPPPGGALERVLDLVEYVRVRRTRPRLSSRLETTRARAEAALERWAGIDPLELDAGELARGPLDEAAWVAILIPWLVARLLGEDRAPSERAVAQAVVLEQRFGAELGRRLMRRGLVERSSDVAYLTIEERVRAVHGDALLLLEAAADRRERVATFLEIDLPARFWGRPRVEAKKSR
jgi:hypothetical protein